MHINERTLLPSPCSDFSIRHLRKETIFMVRILVVFYNLVFIMETLIFTVNIVTMVCLVKKKVLMNVLT